MAHDLDSVVEDLIDAFKAQDVRAVDQLFDSLEDICGHVYCRRFSCLSFIKRNESRWIKDSTSDFLRICLSKPQSGKLREALRISFRALASHTFNTSSSSSSLYLRYLESCQILSNLLSESFLTPPGSHLLDVDLSAPPTERALRCWLHIIFEIGNQTVEERSAPSLEDYQHFLPLIKSTICRFMEDPDSVDRSLIAAIFDIPFLPSHPEDADSLCSLALDVIQGFDEDMKYGYIVGAAIIHVTNYLLYGNERLFIYSEEGSLYFVQRLKPLQSAALFLLDLLFDVAAISDITDFQNCSFLARLVLLVMKGRQIQPLLFSDEKTCLTLQTFCSLPHICTFFAHEETNGLSSLFEVFEGLVQPSDDNMTVVTESNCSFILLITSVLYFNLIWAIQVSYTEEEASSLSVEASFQRRCRYLTEDVDYMGNFRIPSIESIVALLYKHPRLLEIQFMLTYISNETLWCFLYVMVLLPYSPLAAGPSAKGKDIVLLLCDIFRLLCCHPSAMTKMTSDPEYLFKRLSSEVIIQVTLFVPCLCQLVKLLIYCKERYSSFFNYAKSVIIYYFPQ